MARVATVSLQDEAITAMRDYGVSVLTGRAIPSVKDGLKPVQRRLLNIGYTGYPFNKPYSKSARMVGDTMGRLHPHGDSSIYEAMVRLAQDWVYNIPFIDGQGNFGSMDGDSAAAMRYTEMRLSKACADITDDLKELPEYWNRVPNYDGKELEYTVLPARFPVLPVNGAEGVGVGLATKIPPHNLREIIKACQALIKNPNLTLDELKEIVPGPDFPTGGVIQEDNSLETYAQEGGGTIYIEGRWKEEKTGSRLSRSNIVIEEVPYGTNKSFMLEQIENLRRGTMEIPRGKGECYPPLQGVKEVRDESNKNGIRIVLELRGSADIENIMRSVRARTCFRIPFSCNFTALNIHGRPKRMNLHTALQQWIEFRRETVWERSFESLTRQRNLLVKEIARYIVSDRIDEIIKIIRQADGRADAIDKMRQISFPVIQKSKTYPWSLKELLAHTNPDMDIPNDVYYLTKEQASIIVDLRLHFLTKISQADIVKAIKDILKNIKKYENIVDHDDVRDNIIIDELSEIDEKYGTERRTTITDKIILETPKKNASSKASPPARIWVTEGGLMAKSETPPHREGDKLLYSTIITDRAIALTCDGQAIAVPAEQIMPDPVYPEALSHHEKAVGIDIDATSDPEAHKFLLFVTSAGSIRKSPIGTFINNRRVSQAMKLPQGETIIKIFHIKGDEDIALLSEGQETRTIRFSLADVRPIESKASTGIRGINHKQGCVVTDAVVIPSNEETEDTLYIREKDQKINPNKLIRATRGGRGTPVA